MKYLEYILLIFFSIGLVGCTDNYISQVNSKSILEKEIPCMKLLVFPPDKFISNTLGELYSFDNSCNRTLLVSYKSSIVCNSNQNSQKKALGMAKSYLRLELKEGKRLLYSYYIDLDENLENEDVEDGFNVMRETLKL